MRLSSITIDADGSPSGYVAWYNHTTNKPWIRAVRPSGKNDRYGVQRMEMLAIYFALYDNYMNMSDIAALDSEQFKNILQDSGGILMKVRSDSKSSIEQLQGLSEVRDTVLRRICAAIKTLREKMPYGTKVIFTHLERNENIAGLLLEQRRRRELEAFMEEPIAASVPLQNMIFSEASVPGYSAGFLGAFPKILRADEILSEAQ